MESSIFLKSVPLIFEDQSKLLKALYDQQKKSQLCDVSLVVENVSFPAHKCVLAAHSDYFYALFDQGKQSDEAGSKACNVTTIHLSSINVNTFIPILHYLYTSRLHVFSENIRDLMRTARKLQISAIVKACDRLLSEDIVLPSVHEVQNKQASNAIVTQSTTSQSVLYVDLRSEDDDEYQVVSSMSTGPTTVESITEPVNQPSQSSQSYSLGKELSSIHRGRKTQKKKTFPKKFQQTSDAVNSRCLPEETTSAQNISTVSPASIFGRVGPNQSSRSRTITSPMLPLISSSDGIGKPLIPSSSLSIEPLPFESNLESLGSIFGGDSALIMESMPSDNSISIANPGDKTSCVTSTKSTDSLQLQSVFSMSPKLSAQKPTLSSGDWSKYKDTLPRTSDTNLSPNIAPALQTGSNIITLPTSSLQSPEAGSSNTQSSVYTCKECFKYFTTLPEAFNHFYSEHHTPTSRGGSRQANSSHTTHIAKNHSCPHCGRIFNNKNNLKRHILIKHTSDKRFKCSLCGRRYAIRQSLQYHMRSVHGRDAEEAKSASNSETAPSPTPSSTTYQFEPIVLREAAESSTENFSFSISATSGNTNVLDTYQNLAGTAAFSSTGAYLTTVSLQTTEQDNAMLKESLNSKDDNNLPTIQRIESIRSNPIQLNERSGEKQIQREESQDVSDSNSIKAEPRGQTNHSNNKGGNAFPGGNSNAFTAGSTIQALMPAYTIDLSKSPCESGQTVPGRVTPKLHRCDNCARIFSTLHAYTRHRRSCHKHECPICHRGFSQMGNMRRHIKIFHCEQKPFECHLCHKAYGIKQSFRYHMRDKHGSTDISKSNSKLFQSTAKKPTDS